MAEYWDRYWRTRSNRRRFLGAAGTVGAGAAGLALVGCGDDDDSGGGLAGLATPTPAGATAAPADPFAGAVKGGTIRGYNTGDPPSLDPYGNTSFLTKSYSAFIYSRLFRYKSGVGIMPANVRPTPDLAEGAENTPDGLKWTVKLKKGVKFQNVAPVNGRELNSDDVKYSWGRQNDPKNGNQSQMNFVDKVEYPDANTVVFTLKTPIVTFLDVLADTNVLWIMPVEADGKFDPAKDSVGTGPWIRESYTPSVGFKFKKNPNWFVGGFPLADALDYAIIPEYANGLAQFRAGNLDEFRAIQAADLVDTKKQIANVSIFGAVAQQNNYIFFDPDPSSPWNKDDRIRQAISMSQDRDALTDLGYEIKKLQAAGIDARGPWNNLIPAGMTRFWLDPQSKDQGETAKFFKFDPAEAKKLLAAAGAENLNVTYQYTANRYGKTFNDIAEAANNYLNQVGIKTTVDVQDYNSKYFTQTWIGNFKGIAFGLETPFSEAGPYPQRLFTDNAINHSKIKDPVLAKLTADQQLEANEEKRKQIFWEIQRENAKHMYYVPNQAGAGTSWTVMQPHVKNADSFYTSGYGAPTESWPFRWGFKA